MEKQFDAFAKEWVERSIKNPEADLLSPISAYASVISVIGDGKYAMGAYPVRNGQILFECRECISGQKRIQHFQKVGAGLVEKFARDVCGISVELGKRRRRRVARFTFPKKKRAPKKSRKPKRRSVKKSRKPKRRSVKKSRKPKRRSVKKSRKPKRRSAKKSRKPKRRSAKKSRKPKRRSAKKSRKPKRRSRKQ